MVRHCGAEDVSIQKSEDISIEEACDYSLILISPGPGLPGDFPKNREIIARYGPTHRILGVCLGHQAIAETFGGGLINLPHVNHGVTRVLHTDRDPVYLFSGISKGCQVGLYHSWAVDPQTIPECLEVTARSDDGLILALRHRIFDINGVQFHPESIMTPCGEQIIRNWIGY
jgi:anthranilate synthase component 2